MRTGLGSALIAAAGTALAAGGAGLWPAAAALALSGGGLCAWFSHCARRAARKCAACAEEHKEKPPSDLHQRFESMSRRFQELLQEYGEQERSLLRQRNQLAGAVRKRTAELVQANRRLEKLDRVKDEFVSLLAHELRTPLTSVWSYVELLLSYGDEIEAAERREFLEITRGQVLRVTRLVNELLDLSRLRSGKFHLQPAAHCVAEVMREVVASLREVAAKDRHELVIAPLEEGLEVFCDRDRLLQILVNLAGNAVKYSPGGSRVTLRAAPGGATTVITVCDDGPGIPPDERELVFEPFYRARSPRTASVEGTGLGLYLSRELARQMRGDLRVADTEHTGAELILSLPAAAHGAPGQPLASAHAAASADSR
ncbi:MAG: HAMP domain-containing histidine kinase [Planctomycetes bacterium]|nr:HAMP domain-containing histidine kinase [Planctomycetota bacterium]